MGKVSVAVLLAASISTGAAAAERPDAWFCMKARAHRSLYPTDKAAEAAARALGADDATIEKAKRCPRG